MLKEKPVKVEDEAKDKDEDEDDDEVKARDKDVVTKEEKRRKIILKKEEIKIFQEIMEEEEWLIKESFNAIHVESMAIILGSIKHQRRKE